MYACRLSALDTMIGLYSWVFHVLALVVDNSDYHLLTAHIKLDVEAHKSQLNSHNFTQRYCRVIMVLQAYQKITRVHISEVLNAKIPKWKSSSDYLV